MRRRTRLLALPLIAGLLSTFGLTPAKADTNQYVPNAKAAMTWLAAQQNPSGTFSSIETEPDFGLTLDVVLAGLATNTDSSRIDGWLNSNAVHASRYLSDTGMMAKAVYALAGAGKSTTSYGGINPLAQVQKSMGANGYAAGTNAFGQAYAMLGLSRVGTLPPATVSFLAVQQCKSGAFPMFFDADPASHCDVKNKPQDPDGTAMVILALRAAEAKGITAAKAPREKAVAWLSAQQKPSGAFTGVPAFTPSENTNSTGVVAQALATLNPAAVDKAAAWTRTMQVASGKEAGALAYDAQTLTDSKGTISAVARGRWVRSTAQGVLAFAFAPLKPAQPPRYVPTAPYTLAGEHMLNGRQWKTTCEPYSQTERCRTEIWATTVVIERGQFVRKDGWVFNNLTYLPYMTEAAWKGNPLAMHNMNGFTSGGRQWRTECHTAKTGRGACRAYLLSTVYVATPRAGGGYAFSQREDWVFNNIVMFGAPSWR